MIRHLTGLLLAAGLVPLAATPSQAAQPNVIVIMTDDQGYGDLGVHGNPVVQTPHIDALPSRGMTMTNFYVCPVCTPTRAGLMTGRYHYRTRAIDTFRGRAMMDPAETTIAEILRPAGYATGIFGKWHLGDCYPMRAQDQGFEATLVHRGGGIGQPSDPPGAEGKYTDPILFRNGRAEPFRGYCTDVYFREGLAWAGQMHKAGRPFFLYLPTNAPHGPFHDVPPELLAKYKSLPLGADRFPKTVGHPFQGKFDEETAARVYAMIENIDQNVGRVFDFLDREQLAENTLVVFLTDNGRATPGYNAGFRGTKSTVYEGGIHSPFFAVWKGKIQPGSRNGCVAAYIDLLPTILEACGVPLPAGLKTDGDSFWPQLAGQGPEEESRTIVIQAHRGDRPDRFHNFALRTERWKLVNNSGFGPEKLPPNKTAFELFDLRDDPFELMNVAAEHPEIAERLKKSYEAWFDDVGRSRPDNYAPPRILIGTPHENPTILTRQDWRGAAWGPNDLGHWDVELPEEGVFNITLRFAETKAEAMARFRLGDADLKTPVAAGIREARLKEVRLPAGRATLEASLTEGTPARGVMFVELERAN